MSADQKLLRIVFVINSLEGGGAERVISIILGEFSRTFCSQFCMHVDLILLDEAPRQYPIPSDIHCHVLDARGSLPRSITRLTAKVRVLRPDLVVSFLTRANLAAVVAKIATGTRCIISERVNTTSHFAVRHWRNEIARWLVRVLYRRADRVVAVSRGVARDLVENHGLASNRIEVIPNPYNLEELEQAAAQAPAIGLPDRFIVAVGRLTSNKNVEMLLRAFARTGGDTDLVILGDGDRRAALEREAARLGLTGRVHFVGFVANPHAIMKRALAFVSASNAEGFPNAAAEAMALGRPVIMTDCPSGPAELLEGVAPAGSGVVRARYGVLTPVDDELAMADALRLVGTTELRLYGDIARQRMKTFRAAPIAERYALMVGAVARATRPQVRAISAACAGRDVG